MFEMVVKIWLAASSLLGLVYSYKLGEIVVAFHNDTLTELSSKPSEAVILNIFLSTCIVLIIGWIILIILDGTEREV